MAILLQKADLQLLYELGIIDTLNVYVNSVLVASASDDKSIQWAMRVVDEQSQLNNAPFVVIQINADDALDLSNLSSYAPSITEGPSSGTASVAIEDVTLYIPAETIVLGTTAASPPIITEAYYGTGGSVFGAASATNITLGDSIGIANYAPTITEGPSGNASAGYSASVTLF